MSGYTRTPPPLPSSQRRGGALPAGQPLLPPFPPRRTGPRVGSPTSARAAEANFGSSQLRAELPFGPVNVKKYDIFP